LKLSTHRTIVGYAFMAPWLAALVFLIGYPFVASMYFSACDYSPLREPLFVGADNYVELAKDAVFRQSMLVTIAFAIVAIPLGVLLALTLALFLNTRVRGVSFYRVIYYLPHLVPSVVVAILWMWMFNPQFGILNVVLAPFGKVAAFLLTPFAEVHLPVAGWVPLVVVIGVFGAWWKVRSLSRDYLHPGHERFKRASGVLAIVFAAAVIFALVVWLEPVDIRKIQSPGWLTDGNAFPSGLSFAPSWALWSLIYMSMWGVGQMTIIYLAKLQDVPV
jgi:ABC-type sugar transport system permease subunit